MLVPRIGQPVGQRAVVGEQEQPLAVAIEPAHRIDSGHGHKSLSVARPAASVNWQRTSNGLKNAKIARANGRAEDRWVSFPPAS